MERKKRSRAATTGTGGLGEAGATPEDRRRESIVGRLFDGVLRTAAMHLCPAEHPLAAEVWASGLLAVWDDGGTGRRESDRQRAFGEALIRYARSQATPEAMATLVALGAVAPARLATKARTAAAGLTRRGLAAPAWAGQVGHAVATEAWIGRDLYGDQEIVIIAFGYPGAEPAGHGEHAGGGEKAAGGEPGEHTLCVLVDHNVGGIAKDAYPGGPLPVTLARWKDAESSGIHLERVELAAAAGLVTDALLASDFHTGDDVDERLGEVRALLDARLAALPAPAGAGRAELDHDARERLVADFLSSPEAAGLLAEPSVVMVCHSLIAYRCEYGDGDPLRWSPRLAATCLLEHFPSKVGLDEPDLVIVPDVLAAWVRFAARRQGLPEAATGRIVDAVEMCRDEFALFMVDETRFGPAKRDSLDLLASGTTKP